MSADHVPSDWKQAGLPQQPLGVMGWARVLVKGLALVLVTLIGVVCHLLLRLIEWPLFGRDRPWSPYITQIVCRMALWVIGLKLVRHGTPMAQKGAVVANHTSWLDIFTLNACQRIYFVSKAEVAKWPGIGFLAKITGTVFIARKGSEAKRQQELFEDRLRAGHQLLFFPEGTSTDSIRVLPFKSTLFQAFFTSGLDRVLHIQPTTVVYHAPPGADPRFYGWWGDMEFAGSFLQMLACKRHGWVEVILHPSVPVDAFPSRKELSQYCERVIRTAHPNALNERV